MTLHQFQIPDDDDDVHRDGDDEISELKRITTHHHHLTWHDINLIFVMPMFCTIATRLPFIYFVIQLESEFELEYLHISFLIGAYHFCRVIGISGAMISPKLTHFLGTVIGLLGYLTLFLMASDAGQSLVRWLGGTIAEGVAEAAASPAGSLITFATGNIVVGLAEASAATNVYAKREYHAE